MTPEQRAQAEKIYDVLTKQRFADFYGYVEIDSPAPMSRHITSDENCPTKDEILEMIVILFHL